VERDFRSYLECGILAHGFAGARCEDCGHERLIPLPTVAVRYGEQSLEEMMFGFLRLDAGPGAGAATVAEDARERHRGA